MIIERIERNLFVNGSTFFFVDRPALLLVDDTAHRVVLLDVVVDHFVVAFGAVLREAALLVAVLAADHLSAFFHLNQNNLMNE